jgi:hypothetical protein
MTINILDSDWTKYYFTLHFKMWWSPLKSAREVNITLVITQKKYAVPQGNTWASLFSTCDFLRKMNNIKNKQNIAKRKSTWGRHKKRRCNYKLLLASLEKRLAQVLPWWTAYFFFVMTITVEKNKKEDVITSCCWLL